MSLAAYVILSSNVPDIYKKGVTNRAAHTLVLMIPILQPNRYHMRQLDLQAGMAPQIYLARLQAMHFLNGSVQSATYQELRAAIDVAQV